MTDTTDPRALVERLTGFTPGPWSGHNMVHEEGRQMTPEEIGEYVCNSVKMGDPSRFLFVSGKHDDGGDCDVCHTGNGPRGPANTALIAAAPDLHSALTAALDQADILQDKLALERSLSDGAHRRAREARNAALREAATCAEEHTHIMSPQEVTKSILALIDAPAPDPVQQAAKVLLAAMAHTDKRGTHAAAREFPQMGFINAGAVIGAALRALAGEGK